MISAVGKQSGEEISSTLTENEIKALNDVASSIDMSSIETALSDYYDLHHSHRPHS